MNDETTPENTSNENESTQDAELSQDQIILDDLKNRAKMLGITHHPSIKAEALREKIQAKLDETTSAPKHEPGSGDAVNDVRRQTKREDALKMVRIILTCMDPAKKSFDGEIFQVANSLVGTLKRYVPFGVEWHVPQMMLNMINEKEYQTFTEVKRGPVETSEGRLVKAYAVNILDPLTEEELKDLEQRQAMASGTSQAA